MLFSKQLCSTRLNVTPFTLFLRIETGIYFKPPFKIARSPCLWNIRTANAKESNSSASSKPRKRYIRKYKETVSRVYLTFLSLKQIFQISINLFYRIKILSITVTRFKLPLPWRSTIWFEIYPLGTCNLTGSQLSVFPRFSSPVLVHLRKLAALRHGCWPSSLPPSSITFRVLPIPRLKKKKKKTTSCSTIFATLFDACYSISSSSEQRRSNTWREASGETPGGHREQPSLSSLFTSFYRAPPACYRQGLSVNKRILNSLGSATKVEAPL